MSDLQVTRTVEWKVGLQMPIMIASLANYMKESAELATMVGTRIFVQEVPDVEINYMPRRTLLLQSAGGPPNASYSPYGRQRVDLRCYGETPYRSMQVWAAAFPVLKHMPRIVRDGVVIQSAIPEAGPVHMREHTTEWNMVFGSFLIFASEVRTA